MAIITISRGSYSRGKEIAEKVASYLGYTCLSREVILDASEHFNIPEIKLTKAIHDAPSIFDRIRHGKQVYIAYIQAALTRQVKKDNTVYHGLAGHLLLKGISHVLKVRIIADLSIRIKEESLLYDVSEQEALSLIQKNDQERRNWTQKLYGVDPWDSSLYDLVICINKFTVDNAVDMICRAAGLDQFKATKASLQKMEDLSLACAVKATLMEQQMDIAVTSEYGNVIIYTRAGGRNLQKIEQKAEKLGREIEGIRNIEVHAGIHYPEDTI
jgi:cytidylate kinase